MVANSLAAIRKILEKQRGINNEDVWRRLQSLSMGDISALLHKLQTQYFFLIYYSKYWLSHTANFDQAKSKCWGSWKQLVLTDDNALAAKPWTVEGWQALDPRVQHSIVDSEHHALLGLSVLEHSLCATADLSTLVLDKCSDRLTHSIINIRGSTKGSGPPITQS